MTQKEKGADLKIQKAKRDYAALKKSLKQIYLAVFPDSTEFDLKSYCRTLNHPRSIHGSVNYFERVVLGRTTNFALSKRIELLKKKLKINDDSKIVAKTNPAGALEELQ